MGIRDAGWSSSVARWAHNPEVAGSNPAPATRQNGPGDSLPGGVFRPSGNPICNHRHSPGSATPLFGGPAAALREHGSATLDEHCCYFLDRSRTAMTANTVTHCDGQVAPTCNIRSGGKSSRPTCRPSRTRTVVLLRRRASNSPLDLTCAATTMGAYDGAGQAARKLWPEGVITDRYHFLRAARRLCSPRTGPCLVDVEVLSPLGNCAVIGVGSGSAADAGGCA